MRRLVHELLRREEGRLMLLGIGLVLALASLGLALFHIQVEQSAEFGASQERQSLRLVRIPAVRGRMFDRHGACLVDSRPSFDAVLYFEELHATLRERMRAEVRRRGKRLDANLSNQLWVDLVHEKAEALGRILHQKPQLDDRAIRIHAIEQRPLPFPLFPDLNQNALAVAKEHHPLPAGVDIAVNPLRYYRHGSLAAHTFGYVTRERATLDTDLGVPTYSMANIRGITGLEEKFDDELRGQPGSRTILINAGGYKERDLGYQPAKAGHDLVLTLDLKCQQAVEAALGEHKGAAVVIDPRNGDVLAIASTPGFDPNLFVPRIRGEDMDALLKDENKPLANRAVCEQYAPGSTFKLLVALAGLESGRLTAGSSAVCTGSTEVGGMTKNCWIKSKGGQHGAVNLRSALTHSCNVFFYEHGVDIGMQPIVAMAQQFHLGERTGIPVQREARGNLPNFTARRYRTADTANVAIGQGDVDTTPLQMACVTAAIANGGRVFAPRLAKSVHMAGERGGVGQVVEEFPDFVRGTLAVRPDNLKFVRDAMRGVVNDADGTGKKAAVPGYVVAGKTGTAQVMDAHNNLIGHRAWFVSFAPYDNPQYAMAIMLEDGDSGGITAAPIAGKIYASVFGVDTEDKRVAHAVPPKRSARP